MTKRMQILIEDAEYRRIQRVARSRGMSVAEWVRQALRRVYQREQRLLERAIADGVRLVTDAEVLQEILHRYVAIARRNAIQLAVMEHHEIEQILSFDRGFDGVPGVTRIG